jgi:hypothetical protein
MYKNFVDVAVPGTVGWKLPTGGAKSSVGFSAGLNFHTLPEMLSL